MTRKNSLTILAMLLPSLVPLAGCATAVRPTQAAREETRTATEANGMSNHGFEPENLDRTADACDNFYQYAVGGWMAKNPIPGAYSRWGSFTVLSEGNRKVLRDILEQAAVADAAKGSNEQKIGDFYSSCMNEQAINAQGLQVLQNEFERIDRVRGTSDLQKEFAHLQRVGIAVPFAFGSEQDAKESTEVIGAVLQGGLGLPDRDYYTKEDEKSKAIREQYVQHVEKMFQLIGDSPDAAAQNAMTVVEMETQLAKASMQRVEMRDPNAIYHRMTVGEVDRLMPNFAWPAYLEDINAPKLDAINVWQPEFLKEVNRMIVGRSLADWKTYLRWHLIDGTAPYLSEPLVQEDFRFGGTVLQGTKELLPRWRRCAATADRALGEALGQEYVKRNFPPEAKKKAQEMVQNLIAALRDDIATLDWMSPETRTQALAKLRAFERKIGYPDQWRDYSALSIERGSYVGNVMRANEFEFQRDLDKIGKPVDRLEWGMTPPTVNAYYNPSMNEIVFPAGILQPPFYDPNADDAFNYGGMGAVIGHELSHGFDDEGSQFDAKGNLSDWWTEEDKRRFEARAHCVEEQFDSYEVEPGLHMNGKLVTGESIADLGGLKIAYDAYKRSLQGKPDPGIINGFTPDQRFFLGWAQVWATNQRPEAARLQIATDPHPMAKFRVNGPLSNLPAFAQAFKCKEGDAMVRPADQRCRIW